ncbi:hypothetical protein GNQ08_20420 [Paenibacillus macerans]|uniref:Uncharacterized protein n=1 Tax=Paenibacillus macerans TaxID=44252 RepID=A0A6N8EX17_PAEMA|nr:hypothetical protein [Paenibacillus macerans]MUG24736.1 hypothetical protein [Paenibacillus macerans]
MPFDGAAAFFGISFPPFAMVRVLPIEIPQDKQPARYRLSSQYEAVAFKNQIKDRRFDQSAGGGEFKIPEFILLCHIIVSFSNIRSVSGPQETQEREFPAQNTNVCYVFGYI